MIIDNARRGIYIGSSLNIYEDASNGGAHLEVATPECSTPAELVAHSEAAQRIVQGLYESLKRGRNEVELFRTEAERLTPLGRART